MNRYQQLIRDYSVWTTQDKLLDKLMIPILNQITKKVVANVIEQTHDMKDGAIKYKNQIMSYHIK